VGLTLAQPPSRICRLQRQNNQDALVPPSKQELSAEFLKTGFRAGVLVLLVGFFLDGGLLKLPTTITFWVLLEAGANRERRASPHDI